MMDKVKRLYEWGEWEMHEFDQCGCKHMSETLSVEEHATLMAKRGELNW